MAIFPGKPTRDEKLAEIDCELAKLSVALRGAILAEDHARQAVLWEEIDEFLRLRSLLRSASV